MKPGRWWSTTAKGRFRCELCPRYCTLAPGQRGFCYVRQATDTGIALDTWGRSSGFCIDPIEKKPLNHFFPGTSVLSFGTAGCNLGCKFCQNWNISKARAQDKLMVDATPAAIADAAERHGCKSVAFTYNDPVIFAEYAIDVANACHERNVMTVAVTAGYITEQAREPFFSALDAANIDLKAFTDDFYRRLCFARLPEVLDTLRWVVNETDTWVEITTLVIEGENDHPDEIEAMTRWIRRELGTHVPLHFTAFHPDFKMMDRPRTQLSTLLRCRDIALGNGLQFVYTGNVFHPASASTWCPNCEARLIQRDRYEIGAYNLDWQRCSGCGTQVPGRFDPSGEPGTWGRRRLPVAI